ncbi:hypothetical protein DFH09DRAFT_987905 [Mycena vulgaris]|nr:hypothetical protein DFH09DRAFT_987905 [Mycena vulgaris]
MSTVLDPDTQSNRNTPTPPIGYHRVEELWFQDGTLVLEAGNALFRIYSGLLARESPIFRDMLRIPQPDDAEAIDGCPVVHLSDDSRDLESFLKAIFDYKFFLSFPNRTDFEILSGILRLSRKYEVDALHRRAVVHLTSAFPMTLREYPPSPSWGPSPENNLRVILLARDLSMDWVLPFAFYRACAKNTCAQFLNGLEVDGVHVELSARDKLLCLEQSLALRGPASTDISRFFWDPPRSLDGCSYRKEQKCFLIRMEMRRDVEDRRFQGCLPLRLWMERDWERLSVCGGCMSAMKNVHQKALQRFWDGLPQRFGLPEWSELEAMKAQALSAQIHVDPPIGPVKLLPRVASKISRIRPQKATFWPHSGVKKPLSGQG